MANAAWFVDGAYLERVWYGMDRQDKVDFRKLRDLLETRHLGDVPTKIGDAYYFDADHPDEDNRQTSFFAALQYPPPNGPGLRVKRYWTVRRKMYWPPSWGGGPIIHPENGRHFELVQQKAVDVGLASNLMRSFARQRWSTLFLVAGDSDFHEPVQDLVEHENVRLILIGTLPTMSTELLPYANAFIDLTQEAEKICRPRLSVPYTGSTPLPT